MQILSKLTAAAVLVTGVAAQVPYLGQPPAYFAPGTFGQTFSDGGYVSAGVAVKPGEYDDISYAAQNGLPAANVGLNQQPYQQPYPVSQPYGGYGGPSPYDQPSYQQPGFSPPPPPTYVAGTDGFQPPPPPTYVAGTGVGDSNGPLVTVGQDIHTGGFRHHKRAVEKAEKAEQFPYPYYGGYNSLYNGYNGGFYNSWYNQPTVTIGQPNAYFAPGTFGTTFSDGGYVSAGVPLKKRDTEKTEKTEQFPYPYYGSYGGLYSGYNGYNGGYYNSWYNQPQPTVTIGRPNAYFAPGTFGTTFSDGGYVSAGVPLKKRQVISAGGYFGGPTVTIGAPNAYFAPGTFGTTFSDGGYVSAGVPTYPSYGSYYGSVYGKNKREVSSPTVGVVNEANVDDSRSNARPYKEGYGRPPPPFATPAHLAAEYNSFGYTSFVHKNNNH